MDLLLANGEWIVAIVGIAISAYFAWRAQAKAGEALEEAVKANALSAKANSTAEDANRLSEEANRVSVSANLISERAAKSAADSESRQSERREGLRTQLATLEQALTKRIRLASKALDGWNEGDSDRDASIAIEHMREYLDFGLWTEEEPWPEEVELLNRVHGLSDSGARVKCEAALRGAYGLRQECNQLYLALQVDQSKLDHLSNQSAPPIELDALVRMKLAKSSIPVLKNELVDFQNQVKAVNSEFNRVDRGEFR